MNLFSQAELAGAKTPLGSFVKYDQPPQRAFSIGADVEARHPQNEAMQNIFQRLQGGKALDRRVSHWWSPPYPPVDPGRCALPWWSLVCPDRAVNRGAPWPLSQPPPRSR